MKKIMMTLAAAFVAVTMSAQNNMYIGGTAGFQSKTDGIDNSFTIAPEFGVSLNDKWGVGVSLGFTNLKDDTGAKANVFAFNPYARYNALSIGKVNIFVDCGAYWAMDKVKVGGVESTDNLFGLNVVPGIAYNITDNFSIVAHANPLFSLDFTSPEHGDSSVEASLLNSFDVTTFKFGFYYNF